MTTVTAGGKGGGPAGRARHLVACTCTRLPCLAFALCRVASCAGPRAQARKFAPSFDWRGGSSVIPVRSREWGPHEACVCMCAAGTVCLTTPSLTHTIPVHTGNMMLQAVSSKAACRPARAASRRAVVVRAARQTWCV